jgi:hypothetical protein
MILHHKGIPIYDWTWQLLPSHIELMISGWTMQFVMGIAFFILPRFSDRDNRYGSEYLGWWSFYLLNGGVCLSAIAQSFEVEAFILSGRLLILLAVVTYTAMIWQRVKPLGGYAATQNS